MRMTPAEFRERYPNTKGKKYGHRLSIEQKYRVVRGMQKCWRPWTIVDSGLPNHFTILVAPAWPTEESFAEFTNWQHRVFDRLYNLYKRGVNIDELQCHIQQKRWDFLRIAGKRIKEECMRHIEISTMLISPSLRLRLAHAGTPSNTRRYYARCYIEALMQDICGLEANGGY